MSVVYNRRGLANTEYWKELISCENSVRQLLLRDFGVKLKVRTPEWYVDSRRMTPEDAKVFRELCQKYGMEKITDMFPAWIIDSLRQDVLDAFKRIKQNIRDAYDVYPYYESEYFKRRNYQGDAIRACGELFDAFSSCKAAFPIDADRYDKYVGQIEHVADLLKDWKKRENKILTRIREREEKEREEKEKKKEQEKEKEQQKVEVSTAKAEDIGQ